MIMGFELGALSAEGNTSGTPDLIGGVSLETTIVHSGLGSLKVVPASGATGYFAHGPGVSSLALAGLARFARAYILIASLPATARTLVGSGAVGVSVVLNPSGTLKLLDAAGATLGTSTTALTDASRWYRVEWGLAAANGTASLAIDGNTEVSATAATTINIGIRLGADDTVAATYTAYFDDVVIDNAANPGPGNVAVLRPTSLNAAGGWKDGNGTSAPAATTVATRPPPGVASAAETLGTNIKSATNSATDNCDMNMTTYVAAGVSGTVNAVQSVIREGEDIATGTKAGAALVVSNPTQASEDTWNYGNDAGAHAAEVNLWISARGTVLSSPTVTIGTAPVLRVGKRTATTRVVCVDAMAIYVDYTPPIVPPRRVLQAIARAASY